MSVPAHVHRDAHGDPDDGWRHDDYEEYFGYDFGYDANSIYNIYGSFLNPYVSSNPLHYLMNTTAQMADHFGSNGPYEGDGNDIIGGNPLPEEITYLNSMNLSSFGPPTVLTHPLSYDDKVNIRSKMFPQAIRATAGLLYWFANQVGLSSAPLSALFSVKVHGNSTLYSEMTGHWYVKPENGIEPFTYNWEIMYLDGGGYLESYEDVKKEKDKKDKYKKDKKKDDLWIEAAPSEQWVPVGTNSKFFEKPHNPYDLRDFYLRCTVTDGSNTTKTSTAFFVDVVSYPPPQTNILQAASPETTPFAQNLTPMTQKNDALITEENVPECFALEQNYPNPFNPSTSITYTIPEGNSVTLKVYDMLGREAATLVNANKPAGRYTVEFNASSANGGLPSGTYVYKLTSGSYSVVKKMSFVK